MMLQPNATRGYQSQTAALVSKGIEFNNARLASARMQALTTS